MEGTLFKLPTPAPHLAVNLQGARIIDGDGAEGDPDVYLPMHEEMISHIALDIGGSLAKVVYFTRPPKTSSKRVFNPPSPTDLVPPRVPSPSPTHSSAQPPPKPNGFLGPKSLSQQHLVDQLAKLSTSSSPSSSSANSGQGTYPPFERHIGRRRSSASRIPPGGRLNFTKFETSDIDSLISFLSSLIASSAASNRVPLEIMKRSVKIMATGGGAHKFYDRLHEELGVEVRREEEMECLVLGLGFVMEVPNEVFWYSDELVQAISHPHSHIIPAEPSDPFPRPSPNPPQYSLQFDSAPSSAQFPCLLVNIGSGVSIIKIDDYGKYERISGTSLGGGTLWGLLSLLTGAQSFDDMLALADKGDNSTVDMLVGDIYGQDYQKIGLKSSTIASSFGKVFRKDGNGARVGPGAAAGVVDGVEEEGGGKARKSFKAEDVSKSLLYAISNNIGQIAFMNAEKHNLDRIYFAGGFIRGHAATISTLSYAIRFWSKGTKKAHFLRHDGFLGGVGAWLRNLNDGGDTPQVESVSLSGGGGGTTKAEGVPLPRDPSPLHVENGLVNGKREVVLD